MGRRKFTVEFKRSAVQLVRQQGYTVVEAARSLGVDPASVRGWLVKYGDRVDSAPPDSDPGLRSENQRLRKENAQLRMEREILKKAAVFFAKDQP